MIEGTRLFGTLDAACGIFIGGVGLVSLWTAWTILRARVGGLLIYAFCAKLIALGIWGFGIMLVRLYEWKNLVQVDTRVYVAVVSLQLLLASTQLVVLCLVLPRIQKEIGKVNQ